MANSSTTPRSRAIASVPRTTMLPKPLPWALRATATELTSATDAEYIDSAEQSSTRRFLSTTTT